MYKRTLGERLRRWVWLSRKFGIGTLSSDGLIDYFDGDIDAIYDAGASEYESLRLRSGTRLRSSTIEALSDKSLDEADEIIEACESISCGIITPDSPFYPSRLKRIEGRPMVLYYSGTMRPLDNEVAIAMVGTRDMTEYGQRNAYSIAYDLSRAGAVVVSGMALGIDGITHRGCLDAGGYTVAVIGCGLDVVYPKDHRNLMREIAEKGLIISEYPPGTKPVGHHFPQRNRIISGLSLGTVVIEAGKSSGALITANTAIEQGRDLYALPGKAGEITSLGTNELIKKGATMITDATEILNAYIDLYPNKIDLSKMPSVRAGMYRVPRGDRKIAASVKGYGRRGSGKIEDIHDISVSSENAPKHLSPESQNSDVGTEKEVKPSLFGRLKNSRKAEKAAKKERDSSKDNEILKNLESCSEDQRKIYDAIPENGDPVTADVLSAVGMPMNQILTSLTMLEIFGLIEGKPGGKYARVVTKED